MTSLFRRTVFPQWRMNKVITKSIYFFKLCCPSVIFSVKTHPSLLSCQCKNIQTTLS